MNTNGSIVHLNQVVKAYHNGVGDVTVLREVSLEVKAGGRELCGPSSQYSPVWENRFESEELGADGSVLGAQVAEAVRGDGSSERGDGTRPRIMSEEEVMFLQLIV